MCSRRQEYHRCCRYAPPAFDSPEFANDVVRYGWGKQQRQDKDRLEMAIADAEWDDLQSRDSYQRRHLCYRLGTVVALL